MASKARAGVIIAGVALLHHTRGDAVIRTDDTEALSHQQGSTERYHGGRGRYL